MADWGMTIRQAGYAVDGRAVEVLSRPAAAAVVIGAGGVIPLPTAELARLGVDIGGVLELEPTRDGLLIRPRRAETAATIRPAPPAPRTHQPAPADGTLWSTLRKASILINTACSGEDFALASAEVRRMGIDPREIWSDRPEAA